MSPATKGARKRKTAAASEPVRTPADGEIVEISLDDPVAVATIATEAELPVESPEAIESAVHELHRREENSSSEDPKPRPKKKRKVRTEEERALQRQIAQNQRLRHAELLKTWMPTQRGANITLRTRIGSQTVEGWFKRTFVRLSRMLYRIHTFPLQSIAPAVIALIEKEVLAAILKTEETLSRQIGQCEEMLERLGAQKAFYSKHFELEIIVSTKTAMALHAIYHRADELFLCIESLDFAGVLTDSQRQKQIGGIHAAIFRMAQSIERFHTGVYVRIAKAAPDLAEVDASEAAAEGRAVDLVANEAIETSPRPFPKGEGENPLEDMPLDPKPLSAGELRRMLPDLG
jgi:site-specific DNA-cytosine methylase